MCGLVGVYGDLYIADLDVFKQSLQADYFRGKHSVGIASLGSSGADIFKSLDHPAHFLDQRRVQNALSINKIGVIGHNRHATMGGVSVVNAHPFTHGDITLAHNGTLSNKIQLESKFKAPNFDTDSELVCWLLDNHNTEDVLKELQGAFALTWFDSGQEALFIVRNDERPMSYLVSSGVLHWASEKFMLTWIADRNNLEVIKDKKYLVKTLPVGTLLRADYDSVSRSLSLDTTEVELASKYVAPVYNYGANSNYNKNRKTYDCFKVFNETFCTDFKKGEEVYAWFEDFLPYKNNDKGTATFQLACHPFCSVKVYGTSYVTDYSEKPEDGDPILFKLKLESCNRIKFDDTVKPNSFNLVCDPEYKQVQRVNDKGEDSVFMKWYEDIDEEISLRQRTDELLLDAEETKKLEPPVTLVRGFDKQMITKEQFKKKAESGCCLCGDPIDAEAEILDRTAKFIDDDNLLCSDCQSYPSSYEYLGIDKKTLEEKNGGKFDA